MNTDRVGDRQIALDPARSFIVEAPAGSGKTELLIQRFLQLLASVERPEQIVAITFTRKAAAEMRQRIVATLQAAQGDGAGLPEHRQQSLALARAALNRSQRLGWQLEQQARRLRISTIDSLNANLSQQLPLLAGGTGDLPISDRTDRLYSLAAMRTTESLADATPTGKALRCLLGAADNSVRRLEGWLADCLPRRDRWLRRFSHPSATALADGLTADLETLAKDRVAGLRQLIGAEIEAQLFTVLSEAHSGAELSEPVDPGSITAWSLAASFLLKADGDWRQRFTRREGIPAGNNSLKQRLQALLPVLQGSDGLKERLSAIRALPIGESLDAQRELLSALEVVLPRLLAELRVLFQQTGGVDYTEHALAASQALGAAEEPSDLLLALDRRIEHILVDEFQDTSHQQWQLLELLTSGWVPGDGRTLFVVGDPMQSIYRFRDADLSLFVRARRSGLGGISLEPLKLRTNHRSAREIVDWVNGAFASVFPEQDHPETGTPGYSPSLSERSVDDSAGVELHLFRGGNPGPQIARIIDLVRRETDQDPSRSIGILVRSRSHLAGLRAALRHAELQAHAIEIDSPTDTQLGQDLIGFCQALLHPGDRLSWLGLLRSPWCGLGWTDLLELAGSGHERSIWQCLQDPERLDGLSANGRARVEWLTEQLSLGFELRASRPLVHWLRECWTLIDGPAALNDSDELPIVEQFFAEIGRLDAGGDLEDPAMLRRHFSKPLGGQQTGLESGIQIMTIHRAKGLEFDTVILPGLGRIPRGNTPSLLNIQDIYLSDGQTLSLVAAHARTADSVAGFVQQVARDQDEAERGRVLYVGVTRARQRLHLIGSVAGPRNQPRAGSLLATLWPALGEVELIESGDEVEADSDQQLLDEPGFTTVPFRRLSFDSGLPLPASAGLDRGQPHPASTRPDFEWVQPASVQVGTLIHRELQQLAESAAEAGRAIAPQIELKRFESELALLGVEDEDLSQAARRVAEALDKVWQDPTGRWILEPHAEAWSEFRITVRNGNLLEHLQLDRSFVDEAGRRWVIDYKTGRHLGSDVEGFLDAEVERYRGQLEKYAAAVAAIDARPLRLALYFPLMQRLKEMPGLEG